jgi:hypothetical protein
MQASTAKPTVLISPVLPEFTCSPFTEASLIFFTRSVLFRKAEMFLTVAFSISSIAIRS